MASVGNIFIATISKLNDECTNSQDLVTELAQQLTDSQAQNDKLAALESTSKLLALSVNTQEIDFYSNCLEKLITLTDFNRIIFYDENDFVVRLQNISINLIEAGSNASNLKLLLDKITFPYQENMLTRRINGAVPGQSTSLIDIAIVQKNSKSLEVLLSVMPTSELRDLVHSWITTENIFPLEVVLKLPYSNEKQKNRWLIMASEANRLKVIELLFEHKAEVNAFNNRESALLAAAAAGQHEALALLIKQGADVNHPNYTTNGIFPLTEASHNGNTACVKLLIEAGTNLTQTSPMGMTALKAAILGRNIKCAQLLLQYYKGADKAERCTMLLASAISYFPKAVKLLLEHGANANWRDAQGNPIIITSAFTGSIESMRALLEHGADINALDIFGCTILELLEARKWDNINADACIEFVQQYMAEQRLRAAAPAPVIMSASNKATDQVVAPKP